MKIKTAMGPVWILLLIPWVVSNPLCPDECTCLNEGSGGSYARCHGAFPHFSSFKFELQHLEISDATDMPPFSLVPSYFSGSNLRKLVSVQIRNTSLVSVSDKTFDGLTNLYHVDLSDNPSLYVFHLNAVSGAPALTLLALSGSTHLFNTMSGPILRSDSLTELDLSRCGIIDVHPDAFSLLKKLTSLNLADNNIKVIPPRTFDRLLSLEDLDLSGNYLTSLPGDMLAKNNELAYLSLRGNPISKIPDTIFGDSETALIELDLSGTQLKTLAMPPMRELQHLNLNGSQISSIYKLAMFPSLKHLNLSETKINSLEANSFAGNRYMETLLLSGNPLLRLPSKMNSEFANLYLLDLSNCDLKELVPDFFVPMKHIATLNLSRNALSDSTNLGRALLPLLNLRVLDLSYNKLRMIEDEDLKNQQGLTRLILNGNPLISPPSLWNLPSIRRLEMSRCSLTRLHLPSIFRQGPKLRYIFLTENQLVSLFDGSMLDPDEYDFSWIPPQELAVLDLNENPWSCDPPFTSLIYEMIRRGVAPSTDAPPNMVKQGSPRDLDAEWRLLEIDACEDTEYETDVMLRSDEPPIEMEVTKSSELLTWSVIGAFVGFCLLSMLAICKVLSHRIKKRSACSGKAPVLPDAGKMNVSLVSPTAAAKKVKVKEYQRLHEDRSPNSPLTPRIYKPPSGTQYVFPSLDVKGQDCDENYEEDCEEYCDVKNNNHSQAAP